MPTADNPHAPSNVVQAESFATTPSLAGPTFDPSAARADMTGMDEDKLDGNVPFSSVDIDTLGHDELSLNQLHPLWIPLWPTIFQPMWPHSKT